MLLRLRSDSVHHSGAYMEPGGLFTHAAGRPTFLTCFLGLADTIVSRNCSNLSMHVDPAAMPKLCSRHGFFFFFNFSRLGRDWSEPGNISFYRHSNIRSSAPAGQFFGDRMICGLYWLIILPQESTLGTHLA